MSIFSEKDIACTYHDLDFHRKIQHMIVSHSTNQRDIRDFAYETIDFSQVSNILDLGCAFGYSISGLKGKIAPNTHIVGFDLQNTYQQPFLEACRNIGATGEFHLSDVAELASYPKGVFNLVISSYSLYFFPEIVGDIANILKNDGVFVAITHSQDVLHELVRHIPPTMQSLGVKLPDILSIQKLFHTFSFEQGENLLTSHFIQVEKKLFANSLRFQSGELNEFEFYLTSKQNLFLKEVCDLNPDSVGEMLHRIMMHLCNDAEHAGGVIEFNKNDGVFICRKPSVRRKEHKNDPRQLKFCSACAHPLSEKLIEWRKRFICTSCGYIAYENPLPVAASVVVKKGKEVLLVKRANHPMKGMWCLPCGFAEIDERIEEAVLRELQEETHLSGSIGRLIDAQTGHNYFYGNMLMISYEVIHVKGQPKAGDDAAEARYFPLDHLPPLAFSSHASALQKYKEMNDL